MLREFGGMFLFGVAAFTSIFIGADLLFRIAQLSASTHSAVWLGAVTKSFVLRANGLLSLMSVLMGTLVGDLAHVSGQQRTHCHAYRGAELPAHCGADLGCGAGHFSRHVLFNEVRYCQRLCICVPAYHRL